MSGETDGGGSTESGRTWRDDGPGQRREDDKDGGVGRDVGYGWDGILQMSPRVRGDKTLGG